MPSVLIQDQPSHIKLIYENSGTHCFFSKTGLIVQKEDDEHFFLKNNDYIKYLTFSEIKDPILSSLDELISFILTSAVVPQPTIINSITEYLSKSFPVSPDSVISVSTDIATTMVFSLKIHKGLSLNNVKLQNIELLKKNSFGLCKYKLVKNSKPVIYRENDQLTTIKYEPPRNNYKSNSKLEIFSPTSSQLIDFNQINKESKIILSGFLEGTNLKTIDLSNIDPLLYTVTDLNVHPTDYEYFSLFIEYVNSNTEVFASLTWTEENNVLDILPYKINESIYGEVRDVDISNNISLAPKSIMDIVTLKKSNILISSYSIIDDTSVERNAIFAYGIDGTYITHYILSDQDFTPNTSIYKVSDNVFVLEKSPKILHFFQIDLNLKLIAFKYILDVSSDVNNVDISTALSMKFIELPFNDYFGLFYKISNTSFKYILLKYSNTKAENISVIVDNSIRQYMTSGYAYGQLGFMVHSSQGDGSVRHYLKFYGFDMEHFKFKRPVQQTLSFGGYYPESASLLNMSFNNLFCVKAGGYQHAGSSVYQSSIIFYDTLTSTKLGEYAIDRATNINLYSSSLLTEIQDGYIVLRYNNQLFSVKIDVNNSNTVNLSKTGITSITQSNPNLLKFIDDTSDDITKEHQMVLVSNVSGLQREISFEWTFVNNDSLVDKFGNEFVTTSNSYSFDTGGLVTTSDFKLQHTPDDFTVFQSLSNNWRQKIRLTIPSSSNTSKFQTKFENVNDNKGFHISLHNSTLQFAGFVRLEDGNTNQILFFRSYDASGIAGGLFDVEHEFEFSYEGIPLGSDPADPNRYAITKIFVDGIEVVSFNNNSIAPYTAEQIQTGVFIPNIGYYEVHLQVPGTKIKEFSIGTNNLIDLSYQLKLDYLDKLDLKDAMFNIKTYLPSWNDLKTMTGSETFVMNSPMPSAADHMQNNNNSWNMIIEFTGANSTQSIFFGTGTDTGNHHVDYGGWYLSIIPSFVRLHRYVFYNSPYGSAGDYFEFNEGNPDHPATNWVLIETTPLFDENDIVRVNISYDKPTNQLNGSFLINEEVHTVFTPTSQISIGYNQQSTTPYYLKYTGTNDIKFNKVIIYK